MSRVRIGLASLCLACGFLIAASAQAATLQEHYQRYIQFMKERQFLDAVPEGRLLLKMGEQALGRKNPQTGVLALNLAILYSGLGWYDRAAPYFDEARDIIMSTADASNPLRDGLLKQIASFDLDRGDYEKAAEIYKQLSDKARAKGDTKTLLDVLTPYSRSVRFTDPTLSMKILTEAQGLATKAYGKKDPRIGSIVLEMGETDLASGRLDDAQKIYDDVIRHLGYSGGKVTWAGYAARQEEALVFALQDRMRNALKTLKNGGIGRYQFENNRDDMHTPYNCRTDDLGHIPPDQWVYIGYGVDGDGRVINFRVIAANPPLVNDRAVLKAMQGWRLRPDDADKLSAGLAVMRMFIRCVPSESDPSTSEETIAPHLRAPSFVRIMNSVPAPVALADARSKYQALLLQDKEDAALGAAEDSLAAAMDASGQPDLRTATAWFDYGLLLAFFDHNGEARIAGQRALAIFEKHYSKDDPKLFPVLVLLASTSGPVAGADYSSRAADFAKAKTGDIDLSFADALFDLASVNYSGHEADVQASFDIYAKNPNTNPEEFAARLLAYAKSMFGRNTKKAIAVLERILSGPGASLPPTDPYVRAAHYYLAALLADANATPEEITEANRHADAVGVEPDPIFAALVRTMPLLDTGGHFKYPQDARQAGVEGEATISYRINEMGKVEDAVVVESFPVGVFDKSALDIIKDWKYPPVMGDVPVARMWIKFRFTLTQP